VDYIHNLPQILTKTAQQQQAQPSLQHPSKGLDSSKLEHHLVQHKEHVAVVEAKAKEEMTLLARAFTTRETALKQELANLHQAEKDLSKRLHDKSQEAVELEAKIVPLRTRAIELEEAAEATKAKMARHEERSTNQEVQLGLRRPNSFNRLENSRELRLS